MMTIQDAILAMDPKAPYITRAIWCAPRKEPARYDPVLRVTNSPCNPSCFYCQGYDGRMIHLSNWTPRTEDLLADDWQVYVPPTTRPANTAHDAAVVIDPKKIAAGVRFDSPSMQTSD